MPPTATASTADQAQGNLQSYAQNMQSPAAIEQQQEANLGVPAATQEVSGLRQAIANTTNLLNQVAPSVQGRTANSLVTSAQANRQIANESAPISKTLSDQTGKEANASSNLNQLLSRASNLSSLTVQGQTNELNALQKIYDNLSSKEQAAATQALEQQKLDEQKNEFNAGQSLEQQKLGETVRSNQANEALDSKKLTATTVAAQHQQDTVNSISQNLSASAGRDGYVSPQDYQAAANDWVAAGYSLKDFNNYFGQLKNPTNPYYFK